MKVRKSAKVTFHQMTRKPVETVSKSVLRIRIHRIHMFLGLLDPDPLVKGMDPAPAPDPFITMQK